MGSAHSRTSACVSAQHAPTDRDGPTTWTWFTSCLLQMECTDFKRSARTSSRPCRMPVGSLGRRGAIHATSRNDMHVSCQSRRFFSRKTKNLVSRPETSFFIRAASLLATPEARGGGANRSTPRGVFSRENESARGFTLDAASCGGSPHASWRWAWTEHGESRSAVRPRANHAGRRILWRFAPRLTALGLDDGRARIACEPKVNREDTQVENLYYGGTPSQARRWSTRPASAVPNKIAIVASAHSMLPTLRHRGSACEATPALVHG